MAAWPTSVADDTVLWLAKNNLYSSLNGAIDASVTSIVLTDASAFPSSGFLSVDNEVIAYTGKSTNTLTGCTRGADGTVAATHTNGRIAMHRVVAAHHNALKDEVIAIENSLNLTASRLIVTNGSGRLAVSAVTSIEAEYLSGVTSAIQTQLNAKAPAASPTFTGTITTPLTASRVVKTDGSSALTTGQVDLASTNEVTGVLAVANGGTGQSSYTDGQLLIGNSSGNTLTKATLTAGSNISITNGGGSITIAASAPPEWSYVSQSSALNPAVIGTYYLLSGASFTVTLPTAASVAGKGFTFQHNGTSITQVYTFDTTGGQTIGGVASGSYALYTNGETLYIVSDGSNWQIIQHQAVTDWSASVASTITAAGGNPTKGNSGVGTLDTIQWKREGNTCKVRFRYAQSNVTGAASGSGNYQILIPGGITADTSVHSVSTSTTPAATFAAWLLSTAGCNTGTANGLNGGAYLYDSTHFCISGDFQGANNGIWGSAANSLGGNAIVEATATFEFSVAGWRP